MDWFQVGLEAGAAKFDLTLWVTESAEGLRATLDYATDRFEAERMAGMVAHFVRALELMVANPQGLVADLDLLSGAERTRLLREWNATAVPYPREARVEQLFAEQAARTPDAIALAVGGDHVTYRDLEQRSNRLGHHLRSHDVSPGALVALHLERSIDFVVSVLAILKVGAAYVPLETDGPAARLTFLMNDASARVIITRGTAPGASSSHRVIDLEADAPAIAQCPAEGWGRMGGAEDPAYVMYTSGSSGTPKGVVVPHRAIIRLVRGQAYATFAPGQRFMLLASTAFDASTFELWGPLLNGATCVIFPDRWPDLARLERCIRDERVSCLWLTASLFNLIIDQRPEVLQTVAHVITGGEALSVAHVQRAFAALPRLRLTNGYGPTESTTFACSYEIPRQLSPRATAVSIGRPLANTQCHILDTEGRLVPIGVPGELHLGGDGLACGYHRRPELTAEKFIADHVSAPSGGRLYRTGDRACWRADGTIEFLGRFDDQVKVRGFRVELREIEHSLMAHEAVAQAVVVTRPDARDHREPVAFVVIRPGYAVTEDALRGHVAAGLPAYMVPVRCHVQVAPLPLTPNGKVDREMLEQQLAAAVPEARSLVAPRVPFEEELADIWAHVLNLEGVSITTDFFAAGGSSLLALQLALEIERRFGRKFTLAHLLAAPTIEQIARFFLRDEAAMEGSTVLRGQGPGTPLFHIPGAAGVELLPRAIARRLQGECPYFDGLQYSGVDGRMPPLDRVEDIAATLIGQIRRVRPHGPYRLSGFCFGGLVAIEISRQLEAVGEVVENLILWDAFPAESFRRRPFPDMVCMVAERIRRLGVLRALKGGWWLFGGPVREWWAVVRPGRSTAMVREECEVVRTQQDIVAASNRARLRFQPARPRAARISFYRSRQPSKAFWEMLPLGGWDHIFDASVDVQELDCDHDEISQEPAISMIAQKAARALGQP